MLAPQRANKGWSLRGAIAPDGELYLGLRSYSSPGQPSEAPDMEGEGKGEAERRSQ